jgi:DnaA N-terminal domain
MPFEQVGGAVIYAKSEALGPGWVVTALRRHRDEGWPIPQLRKRGNSETPIDIEQYIGGAYGDLFMRGSDLSGLDDAEIQLMQQNGQTRAQGTEPNHAQAGAGATAQRDDQADESEPADDQLEEMAVGDAGYTSLVRLWNRVLNTMQVQMSRHEFNTWVRRTSLLSIANGVATIGTPSAFFKEGFENRYTGAVRSLISDLYVPVNQVRVVITEVPGYSGPGNLSPQHYRVSM